MDMAHWEEFFLKQQQFARQIDKPQQVVEHLFNMAEALGFTIPGEGAEYENLRSELLDLCMREGAWLALEKNPDVTPEKREQLSLMHAEFYAIVRQITKLRHRFADVLESIASDPGSYIENFTWRETQVQALRTFAACLRHGYQRLAFEIPTGGGKSHVLGAVVCAYVEALLDSGLWGTQEVVVLTSRTNLVHQLMSPASEVEDNNGDPEGEETVVEESGIDMGDIRRWLEGRLTDEQIRILTGSSSTEEREKDSLFTVQLYQGLTLERASNHTRKVGLLIADEAHNLTARVRTLINACYGGAFVIGGSATLHSTKKRNPFDFFEGIQRGTLYDNDPSSAFAFKESLINLIDRSELKVPRLITGNVDINLDEVQKTSTGAMQERDLEKVLTSNVGALKEFLRTLFTDPVPLLEITGSIPVRERTWISFVRSVSMAHELAVFCTKELDIPSEAVDGSMSEDAFAAVQERQRQGVTKIVFSCRKLTEGYDVPEVNGIISLYPHSIDALWMLIQELGRGLRLNPARPLDDCLMVSASYANTSHKLATILGVFGQWQQYNGGILAPGRMRDLEMQIIHALQEGRDVGEILSRMTPEERALFSGLEQVGQSTTQQGVAYVTEQLKIKIDGVEWIEDPMTKEVLTPQEQFTHEKARELLAMHGIMDRAWLRNMGVTAFKKLYFQYIGGSIDFCRAVLNRGIRQVTRNVLEELAEMLDIPELSQLSKEFCRTQLATHGIVDRMGLRTVGRGTFLTLDFPGIGGGRMFARRVLGRPIYDFSLNVLEEVADKLELPEINLETKKDYQEKYFRLLAGLGIVDRVELRNTGPRAFKYLEFPSIGKGGAFCGAVLGRTICNISLSDLEEMAEILELPEETLEGAENRLRRYLSLLADHNLVDRQGLRNVKGRGFQKLCFPGIGKGTAFCGKVLCRSIPTLTNETLEELADKLGW